MILTLDQIQKMSVREIIEYIVQNRSFNELLYMVQYGNPESIKRR